MVSDSRPDLDDVTQYLSRLKNIRGGAHQILSRKEATSLRKKQDNLINNYTYTTEDIQKSIETTRTLKKKIGNIAAEKTKVNIAVQAAQSALDDAKRQEEELMMKIELEPNNPDNENHEKNLSKIKLNIEELETDLEKAKEEQKKVLNAESSRIRQLKSNQKNKKWREVNERAKQANKEADRLAYKAELELKKSGQKEAANPYARRKVKPKVLWNVSSGGQENKEEDNDAANTEFEKKENETEAMQVDENNDSALNQGASDSPAKKKLSEQINEMSIDEEAIPRLMVSNTKKVVTNRVRKGMSITEYFERKAAGTL